MSQPQVPGVESGGVNTPKKEGNGSPDPLQQHPDARLGRPFLPFWLRFFPFVLSAVLFLSAFFAVFSPLPLLFQFFKGGRRLGWLAILTNSALIFAAGGSGSLFLYLIFVVALAATLAELLLRRQSLEKAAIGALFIMAVGGFSFGAYYGKVYHLNPWSQVRESISQGLDHLAKTMQEAGKNPKDFPLEPAEVDEWKQNLLVELPSAVAVISLILVWANLVILLRINPGKIRESLGLDAGFFRNWKVAEVLVWPTILAGFFLVVNVPHVSIVAINVFKFLMAIYALQGLSVLSFFFNYWGLRPGFRTVGFVVSVFVMMPLLLSLGFFDLWFDFRGKFRQS